MHVEATREAIEQFLARDLQGPVTMLNLLRFRDVADYSESPDLAPDAPISGADAYSAYGRAVMPLLARAEAEVVAMTNGGPMLIGPADERWDAMVVVTYPNVGAFLEMITSADYIAIAGHRVAALADARLLPTQA